MGMVAAEGDEEACVPSFRAGYVRLYENPWMREPEHDLKGPPKGDAEVFVGYNCGDLNYSSI